MPNKPAPVRAKPAPAKAAPVRRAAPARVRAPVSESAAKLSGDDLRVLALGCLANQTDTDHAQFRSTKSLLDYDVVIWDMATAIAEYKTDFFGATYRGLPSLDENDSARFVSDLGRRREEIASMMELGRTLIVFAAGPQVCYVDTGQRQTSGTGRNARVTTIVKDASLAPVLPFKITAAAADGTRIELRARSSFADFWRAVKDLLQYRGYFDVAAAEPLLVIEDTTRVVGARVRCGRGVVLLLPAPYWRSDVSNPSAEDPEEELVGCLRELVAALREESGNFKLPAWSAGYELPGERAKEDALAGTEADRDALLQKIDAQKHDLATLDQRKILFTGTGVALEAQVRRAFECLGFTVAAGSPGRDDFIVTGNGQVAVVEVKGVTKSAAEGHAVQLEKWVVGYYEEHGVQPKAILVVNTYAETPLGERTAKDFPDQMLPYAKGRGHVLLTGLQLLGAWLDAEAHAERADDIAASLFATTGVWDRYADWHAFLSEPAIAVAAAAAGVTETLETSS